jgi:segregation and condensation protein B
MNETYIKNVVEAALLAAGRPLQLAELAQLFDENARPEPDVLRAALEGLEADYSSRAIEVKETATGFRIQVRRDVANEVSRLWPERPPRYSRALLETLALIAYRQPITRGEIEAVRGVAVNPNIIKTVIERAWVRVVGTRDVPGRPELLGTTKEFLDYFGLRSLEDLPPLAELKAMGEINLQLDLAKPSEPGSEGGSEGSNGAGGAGTPSDANGATGAAAAAATAGAAVAAVASEAVAGAGEANANGEAVAEAGDVEQAQATLDQNAAAEPTDVAAHEDLAEAIASLESVDDQTVIQPIAADLMLQAAAESGADEHGVIEEPATEAEVAEHVLAEGDAVPAEVENVATVAQASAEPELDSGDVTVEVETLGLVEARIEAILETDEPAVAADQSIETGEFEMAELGMTSPPSVIEAEFDADDLDNATSDDDEGADDDEELSASPHGSSELVAAPRDRDD